MFPIGTPIQKSTIKYVALSILMPRGVKKGLNTKKFDRCVTKVKRKSGKKVNPHAVRERKHVRQNKT